MDRKYATFPDHLMDIYTSPTRTREAAMEEDESVTWQASQSSTRSITRFVNQEVSSAGPSGWHTDTVASVEHHSSIYHEDGPSDAGPSNPSKPTKRRGARPMRASRVSVASEATESESVSGPKILLDAVLSFSDRLGKSTPSGSSSSRHGKARGSTSTMGAVYADFSRQRNPSATRSNRVMSEDLEDHRIPKNESNAKRRVMSFNDRSRLRQLSPNQSDQSMLVDSGGSFQSNTSTAPSPLSSNPSMDMSPPPVTRTKHPTHRFSSFSPDAPLPFIGQPENAPSPTPDPPYTSTPRSQVPHPAPPPTRAPVLGMRRPHTTATSSKIANPSLPTRQNSFKPPFKKSEAPRPATNPNQNASRYPPPPASRNTSRPAPVRQVQPVRAPVPAPKKVPSIPDFLCQPSTGSSPPSSPSARPHDGDPNSSIEFGSFNYDMDDVERVMRELDASQAA